MSELSGRVRGVVNTPTPAGASGRWSVRAVNKYVGSGVWPSLAVGAFESIATVTVGAAGASSIEFTSIPATYQHLQVRWLGRQNNGAYGYARVQLNATNQSYMHILGGKGSTAYAQAYALTWLGLWCAGPTYGTSHFAGAVADILDYSTAKSKVVRVFDGYDANTTSVHGGYVTMRSMLYSSVTSAVTGITLTAFNSGGGASSFVEHSTAALYGIKA